MERPTIQLKEMFIYNSKDMNNPGQICGLYTAGLFRGNYHRIHFPKTGEIEYVNLCDVKYDVDKDLYYYDDKYVVNKK